MCEKELEQAYRNTPSYTQINKSAQTNSIVFLPFQKNNHHHPPPEKKIYSLVVVESFNISLLSSIPSPLLHLLSPLLLINLISFKNLHHLTSSTNRLLRAINFALQHTSRTNRLLSAVNFSLKHASGSNGLLGAVDHLGELELLGRGVVGEHVFWVGG